MTTDLESLEQYAEVISEKEPEILRELNRETHQKILRARMLSGHLQGRLLSLLSKLLAPKTILEIGTFTGYSALCLAEGLAKKGVLHTIDINEELVAIQQKYFDKSPYRENIVRHTGDALEIIPKLEGSFDLVFIDADKKNYSAYFDLIIDRMNPGGILITDNVLWYGKVLEPTKKGDKDTDLIKAYNQKLRNDSRLENLLLPIRDGILVSRKKA